ncbi:MAG: histidine phosphatase family protein [Cyanobacteria bacterium P01_E01_bin.48]
MPQFNSPSPGTTRAIFVRHGRSTDNDAQRFQGRSDRSVLTERGWAAARQTGRALRGIGFDAIYTSPLQRAIQTTCALVKQLNTHDLPRSAPVKCPALMEVDLPHWAGRTYASVREELPADYQCWQDSPDAFSLTTPRARGSQVTFPVLDLYAQIRTFWEMLLNEHRGQTVLAIAHGGSVRAAISTAIGLPAKHYHQLQQSNCGISVVEFSEAPDFPPMSLQALNLTGHLHETLPKLKAGKQGARVILMPAESDRLHQPWLRALAPDQCWIDRSDAARSLASQIVGTEPLALFPCAAEWGQTAQALAQSTDAITVLAIASTAFLYDLLSTWLRFSTTAASKCAIVPNTATVIHFPSPTRSPVLQALNFTPPEI